MLRVQHVVRAMAVGAGAFGAVAGTSADTPTYTISPVGLYDADHSVRAHAISGIGAYVDSRVRVLVVGRSARNESVFAPEAGSAWVFDSSTGLNSRIGLTGGDYRRAADGVESSRVLQPPAGRWVFGVSRRYPAGGGFAEDAWIYDHGTGASSRVGYTDVVHTGAGGAQESEVRAINSAGVACGYSKRYLGGAEAGYSAWLRNAGTGQLTRLGYTDAAHTGGGVQGSDCVGIDAAGRVAGGSLRFPTGLSAWVYLPSTLQTRRLGFTDALHTGAGQSSGVFGIGEVGLVVGSSSRFRFDRSSAGETLWVHNIAQNVTREIGLREAEHFGPEGVLQGEVKFYPGLDLVAGETVRQQSGGGKSAWVYSHFDDTTRNVGLVDAEHTLSWGYRESSLSAMTRAGWATGTSVRGMPDGGSGSTGGVSAWVWHPVTRSTTRIGLIDVAHTSSALRRVSRIVALADNGLVTGQSERYAGQTSLGETAWVYDSNTGVTTPLVFSTDPNGGSVTNPAVVGIDGTVYGNYLRYTGMSSENRVFRWNAAEGLTDLGEQVEGGIGPDWLSLDTVRYAGSGVVVGSGRRGTDAFNSSFYALVEIPRGACCLGATCDFRRHADCTGPNTRIGSLNVPCNAPGEMASPCCLANFNQVGGVTVQDVFDFLSAWFVGDAAADFNGANGVSVQDVFDFLSGYFTGCSF
jgi:hypothetical protein